MSRGERTYLNVPLYRPRVAFFELSSCEGCQLQIINNEATLLDFLSLMEVVNFREAMTEMSEDYEIAFVEGSVTRKDEITRLRLIRKRAEVVVAFGSCACFGGVNQLKNRFDPGWVEKEVYGNHQIETGPVRPVDAVVPVDLKIFGCPVKKEEVEKTVVNIALGKSIVMPGYPVCMECKANENVCLFDLGQLCLGPITRAGCDAWCPGNRFGCWGCRGPSEDADVECFLRIVRERGFPHEMVIDRLECFGGFAAHTQSVREKPYRTSAGKSGGRRAGRRK